MSALKPIVFVHYHLRTGGVSRVIDSQVDLVKSMGRQSLILSGEAAPEGFPHRVEIIPELAYDQTRAPSHIDLLGRRCQEVVKKHFGEQKPIWHFHNHALGKNETTPLLVTFLAKQQASLVLQLHDFAEDFRIKNLRRLKHLESLYPLGDSIYYVTLNQRDSNYLAQAGVSPSQLRRIPNQIRRKKLLSQPETKETKKNALFYPVRAIRRKNIGEVLLWKVLAPRELSFSVAQAPHNPQWLPFFERWQEFCKENKISIELNLTQSGQYPERFYEALRQSQHLLTTSVNEGFGLAFLEPLLDQKNLIARNIPSITKDFEENGKLYGNYYQSLLIPLEWVDLSQLRQAVQVHFPLTQQGDLSTWFFRDHIDFARLPESLQESVILQALKDPLKVQVLTRDGQLQPASQWFQAVLQATPETPPDSYLQTWGERRSQQALHELYTSLENSPHGPLTGELNRKSLLESFQSFSEFFFLKQ